MCLKGCPFRHIPFIFWDMCHFQWVDFHVSSANVLWIPLMGSEMGNPYPDGGYPPKKNL